MSWNYYMWFHHATPLRRVNPSPFLLSFQFSRSLATVVASPTYRYHPLYRPWAYYRTEFWHRQITTVNPSPRWRPWQEAKGYMLELIWSYLDLKSLKNWVVAFKSQQEAFGNRGAMRNVLSTACRSRCAALIERLRKINYIVVDFPKILPPLRGAGEELSSSEIASWTQGTQTKKGKKTKKTKKTKKELLWRLDKEHQLAIWGKQQADDNNTCTDPRHLPEWPSQVDLASFGQTTRATIPRIIEQIQYQFSENKKTRVVHVWRTNNGKCISIAKLTAMISFWDSEEEFRTKGELYLWECWAQSNY